MLDANNVLAGWITWISYVQISFWTSKWRERGKKKKQRRIWFPCTRLRGSICFVFSSRWPPPGEEKFNQTPKIASEWVISVEQQPSNWRMNDQMSMENSFELIDSNRGGSCYSQFIFQIVHRFVSFFWRHSACSSGVYHSAWSSHHSLFGGKLRRIIRISSYKYSSLNQQSMRTRSSETEKEREREREKANSKTAWMLHQAKWTQAPISAQGYLIKKIARGKGKKKKKS